MLYSDWNRKSCGLKHANSALWFEFILRIIGRAEVIRGYMNASMNHTERNILMIAPKFEHKFTNSKQSW